MSDATTDFSTEILTGPMPYGLAMGFNTSDGVLEIEEAFENDGSKDGHIRDVMVLLAQEGLYKGGNQEILIRYNNRTKRLLKRFEFTNHGKMKAFLAKLLEKQKQKATGIIAVVMTADDLDKNSKFSKHAIAGFEIT